MAKREIVWSNRAIKRLYGILEFYDQRNKSKTYPKKLYQLLQKQVKVLIKCPEIGLKTTEGKIIIHTIWDSRQNPESKIIK